MRFRTQLINVSTFASNNNPEHLFPTESVQADQDILELAASLNSLGKICWMRLERDTIHFTIIPDQGTQVWAVLPAVSFSKDLIMFMR